MTRCHGCEEIGEVIYISGAELISPEALRSLITLTNPPNSSKDQALLQFADSNFFFLNRLSKFQRDLKKNIANKLKLSLMLISMFRCATKATHLSNKVLKVEGEAN